MLLLFYQQKSGTPVERWGNVPLSLGVNGFIWVDMGVTVAGGQSYRQL